MKKDRNGILTDARMFKTEYECYCVLGKNNKEKCVKKSKLKSIVRRANIDTYFDLITNQHLGHFF